MKIKYIFYWRIPKTGSTTITNLLTNLLSEKKINFIQLGHDEISFDLAEKQINKLINKYDLKNDEYLVITSLRIPSTHCLSLFSHGGIEGASFNNIIEKYDIKNYEDYLNKLFNDDIVIYNNKYGNNNYYYNKLENIKNIKNLYIIRAEFLIEDINFIFKKYIDNLIEFPNKKLNNYNDNINLTKNKKNKKERESNYEQIKKISNKYFKEIDNLYQLFITDFIKKNK